MDTRVLALLLCVQLLLLLSAWQSTNAMTVAGPPPPQLGREWPPRRFRKKPWRSNCSGRIGACGTPGLQGFPVPPPPSPPPPPPPPRPTPVRCFSFHADHNNHGY